MKKSGFTLAEILISLTIIGIIASLTIPPLISESQREIAAKRLSSAVSAIETGFTNAIMAEGKQDLSETTLWSQGALNYLASADQRKTFAGNLGRYMILGGYKNSVADVYNGATVSALANDGSRGNTITDTAEWGIPIELKNGAFFFITTYVRGASDNLGSVLTEDQAAALGTSLKYAIAMVYIDVNGNSSPNIVGRDIFGFFMGDNGILYPVGSKDVSVYLTNADGLYWNHDSASNWFACTNSLKSGNAFGCTARLIENNYNMNY